MFICRNDKIVVLTIVWDYVVNWYHKYLLHPSTEHIKANICWYYFWPNLRENIHTHIEVSKTFQKNRKQNLKYGNLFDKETESIPWEILLVELIGPYETRREVHEKPLILKS